MLNSSSWEGKGERASVSKGVGLTYPLTVSLSSRVQTLPACTRAAARALRALELDAFFVEPTHDRSGSG